MEKLTQNTITRMANKAITYSIIKTLSKQKLLAIAFCWVCLYGQAQLYTEYAKTASLDSLVQANFGSPNVQIFNTQVKGFYTYYQYAKDIGYFKFTNSSIGISEGIILMGGPLDPPYGLSVPSINYMVGVYECPGDSLLDSIIAPFHTVNAAVLEFDFIPNGDSVQFNYVFASDEYPYQICTDDNDVFAFHISGPGISGQKNIALVPGTNLPVSINSINDTTQTIWDFDPNICLSVSYPQYYVSHANDAHFIFNGSTTVLTASAATIPCQTYHLRFAIGEGGESAGDYSAVFLEANSFNSQPLSIESNISYGNGDTLLYEDCGSAQIVFKRTYNIQQAKTYSISVGGTATNGTDYNSLPTQIIMPAGVASDTLFIIPIKDNIADDGESIILTIGDTLCNGNYYETDLSLVIHDKPDYKAHIYPDTGVFCTETLFQCEVQGAIFPINYDWNSGLSSNDSLNYYPNLMNDYQKSIIYVDVLDACGNSVSDTATVFFSKKPNANFIFTPGWIDLLNPEVKFTDQSTGNVVNWLWKFGENEDSSSLQNPVHFYSAVGDYLVSLHVKNKYNCMDSTARKIKINDIPSLYIPNTFTPNGDGNNDVFQVYYNETSRIEMTIFDRWGKEVYHAKNKKFEWNGDDAPDGVYTYELTVQFKDRQTKTIFGSVNLVR